MKLQNHREQWMHLVRPILLICIISPLVLNVSAQSKYQILGRVVDEKGRPVKAGIIVHPVIYSPKTRESFLMGEGSDIDGRFTISTTGEPGRDVFRFIEEYDEVENMPTVRAPFDAVRQFDKSFDGEFVRLGDNRQIDVGDVKVKFWYSPITLDFSRYTAGGKTKQLDWESAWLRIRDRQNNEVYLSTLSAYGIKHYVSKNGRQLKITLPEGTWKAELANDDFSGPVASSTLFKVKRNEPAIIEMK